MRGAVCSYLRRSTMTLLMIIATMAIVAVLTLNGHHRPH
jgi:hypothetical protein